MTQENYWTRLRSRRITRRRLLRSASVAGVGAAGIALVGCGDDDDDDDDQQAAPAVAQQAQTEQQAQQQAQQAVQQEQAGQQAQQQAVAQAGPKSGGTLNRGNSGVEPPHHDVHRASTAGLSGSGAGLTYNGLVRNKPFDHDGASIVLPYLAEAWEIPDPTTLVFTLRQDAKWHDIAPVNARVATANDVDFSIKRQIAEGANSSDLIGIASQEVVDEFTFSMTLDQVNVDFLLALTDARNSVVTPEAVEAGGGDLEGGPPIGTGAWIFEDWVRDVNFRLRRNPDYFRGPVIPYADNMEIFFLTDPSQQQEQFLAGNIMTLAVETLEEGVLSDLRDDPDFRILQAPMRANQMILMQMDGRAPEILDPRVRQAISIDRDVIIKNVFRDVGTFEPTGMQLPGPDWRLSQEELLDAAGADGLELPDLEVPTYSLGSGTLPMVEITQQRWREVGFDISIRPIDNVELVGLFRPSGADFTLMPTPILHANTLTGDFEAWIKTDGSRNSGHVSDANIDRLINAQKAEFDEPTRRELVIELQRAVVDLMSTIGLTATAGQSVAQSFVKNWDPPPGNGTRAHYEEVWLDV